MYPVTFETLRPERFSRAQLALRLLLFILLGVAGFSLGGFFLLLYLGLPAYAAIRQEELDRDAPRVTSFLRWVVAVYAYFSLLTDRLPTQEPDGALRFEVQATGHPTVGSALLRILYGIPSALVLALVLCVAWFAWVIAFVLILVREQYGRWLYEFLEGTVRWMVRLLAYQASLVDEYPPFTLAEPHVEAHV